MYIKLIEESSIKTGKAIQDVYNKYGPKNYIKELFNQANNHSLRFLSPLVLDEEIIYCRFNY